jgi:hypothetical protein
VNEALVIELKSMLLLQMFADQRKERSELLRELLEKGVGIDLLRALNQVSIFHLRICILFAFIFVTQFVYVVLTRKRYLSGETRTRCSPSILATDCRGNNPNGLCFCKLPS